MAMVKNRSLFFLAAFLLLLLLFPKDGALLFRSYLIPSVSPYRNVPPAKLEQLEIENHLLRLECARLKEWLFQQENLEREGQELLALALKQDEPFFQRRKEHLSKLLNDQLCSLPAKVIFREPATWSNVIWIDVGERDNRALGAKIIDKNSPVVIGKLVIGVVEKVTETKSLVRLLTDRALNISVRATRGNSTLAESFSHLIHLLSLRSDLIWAEEIGTALKGFLNQLDQTEKKHYLAKGEIHGGSAPLWRMPSLTLKGIGFNYDFTDEEGQAHPFDQSKGQEPLIKEGDLLVTTGMDGVFPADLHVAIVTKIYPIRPGRSTYEIEAKPVATDLHTLSEVFVLPPMEISNFDKIDWGK